jgi:hypothetical protein
VTDWEPDTLHPNEVEVCADCLTHSCLTGALPCPDAGRDSEVRTVAELRQLALESPDAYAL